MARFVVLHLFFCVLSIYAADIELLDDSASIVMGFEGDVQLSRAGPNMLATNASISVGNITVALPQGIKLDLVQMMLAMQGQINSLLSSTNSMLTTINSLQSTVVSLQSQIDAHANATAATTNSLQNQLNNQVSATNVQNKTLAILQGNVTQLGTAASTHTSQIALLQTGLNSINSSIQGYFAPSSVFMSKTVSFSFGPAQHTWYSVPFDSYVTGNQIACSTGGTFPCYFSGGGTYLFSASMASYAGTGMSSSAGSTALSFVWSLNGDLGGRCGSGGQVAQADTTVADWSDFPVTSCIITLPPGSNYTVNFLYSYNTGTGTPFAFVPATLLWAYAIRIA